MPIRATIADPLIADALTAAARNKTAARLAASWEYAGASNDVGPLVAFNGGASFAGTYAALTLAWPGEINPRTSGGWWRRLVPDDAARCAVSLGRVPLLRGVPLPDGALEQYGGRETVELRLQDITGVAARRIDYPLPFVNTETVNPLTVAAGVLAGIDLICLYGTAPADGCLQRFPNALAAADDVLIRQQDAQGALAGQRRIRYGDRDCAIVYRAVENPATGAPFGLGGRLTQYDFEYGPRHITGLNLEGSNLRLTTPFINPYIDLASRIRLVVPRANLDEIVEVQDIRWAVNPGEELMTMKCRRQYTL